MLHDKIKLLKAEYVESLKADREALNSLLAELNFQLFEDRTFQELQALAHRHAGSAGSFGFEDLGLASRKIDQALLNGLRDPAQLAIQVSDWAKHLEAALR